MPPAPPAIALPAFLFLYEWLLGEKRYRRVVPFAVIALSFGLQALLGNRGQQTDYTLRFTPSALWTTLSFYSTKLVLAPYGGLLLIPAAWFARDRRIRFGDEAGEVAAADVAELTRALLAELREFIDALDARAAPSSAASTPSCSAASVTPL